MQPETRRVLEHGLTAGLIAYLTVVLLYSAFNLATGRPLFYTAAQLGAVLTGGPAIDADGVLPGPVLAYNGLHMVGMLVLGLICAWLVHEWELHPQLWYAVFAVLTLGAVATTLLIGLYATRWAGATGWGSVVLANLFASVAMALYLVFSSRLTVPGED